MVTSKKCQAKTKNGRACTGYAVRNSKFCFTHSPSRARERAQARRLGGLRKVAPKATAGKAAPVIATNTDVLGLVNATIFDVWLQENTAPRARTLLAAGDAAVRALQIGELEERVRALEQRLEVKP